MPKPKTSEAQTAPIKTNASKIAAEIDVAFTAQLAMVRGYLAADYARDEQATKGRRRPKSKAEMDAAVAEARKTVAPRSATDPALARWLHHVVSAIEALMAALTTLSDSMPSSLPDELADDLIALYDCARMARWNAELTRIKAGPVDRKAEPGGQHDPDAELIRELANRKVPQTRIAKETGKTRQAVAQSLSRSRKTPLYTRKG
jgi:hypothetical protein